MALLEPTMMECCKYDYFLFIPTEMYMMLQKVKFGGDCWKVKLVLIYFLSIDFTSYQDKYDNFDFYPHPNLHANMQLN